MTVNYRSIRNGNIKLNRKNAHERGYVETSIYQIIISNYKEKMNRHLWLCKRICGRWIGKKILLGTENHRKANINVPNSFKPQGNNRRKKMQSELLLQNRFRNWTTFINSSSRKILKAKQLLNAGHEIHAELLSSSSKELIFHEKNKN